MTNENNNKETIADEIDRQQTENLMAAATDRVACPA